MAVTAVTSHKVGLSKHFSNNHPLLYTTVVNIFAVILRFLNLIDVSSKVFLSQLGIFAFCLCHLRGWRDLSSCMGFNFQLGLNHAIAPNNFSSMGKMSYRCG